VIPPHVARLFDDSLETDEPWQDAISLDLRVPLEYVTAFAGVVGIWKRQGSIPRRDETCRVPKVRIEGPGGSVEYARKKMNE